MKIIALLRLKKTNDGGRVDPVKMFFKPSISIGEGACSCKVLLLDKQILKPGEACNVEVSIPSKIGPLKTDSEVKFYEGFREVATGTVKSIVS